VVTPSNQERQDAKIDGDIGAKIDSIDAGSPASEKMKLDDLVIAVNGQTIRNSDHFVRAIGEANISEPAVLTVYREGKKTEVKVTLQKRDIPPTLVSRQSQRLYWRGLVLGPIPGNWELDGKKPSSGLMVVAMDPKSPLSKQGIKQGSVITSVAGRAISSLT